MIKRSCYLDTFLIKFTAFVTALHIVYGTFLQHLFGKWFDFILFFSAGWIILLLFLKKRVIIVNRIMLGWICIGLFALFHVGQYKYVDIIATFSFIFFVFLMLFSENYPEFIRYFLKFSIGLALVSAISALIFYVFPVLYNPIFSIYGGFVANTDGGSFGYRAGLTPHTSWQGVICSVAVLYDGCILITNLKEMAHKEKMIRIIRIVIIFSALILSAKRGSTLFVILSLIFIYAFVNQTKVEKKVLIFLALGLVFCFGFEYMTEFIPGLEYMISRFNETKNISSYRFQMWELALKEFKNHIWIGIGWFQYRYAFSRKLFYHLNFWKPFMYTDAHNVYIQILCETGIIGFTIYVSTITATFVKMLNQTKKIIRHNANKDLKSIVMACFGIQLYFVFYSLVGNPLYDYTFAFYAISCGMTYCLGGLK